MLRKGNKITTPKDDRLIKVFKNNEKNTITSSFFHTISEKDSNGQWQIKESYVINVSGVELTTNQKIVIDEINGVEPKMMKSKNGKTYLNVVLYIKCRELAYSDRTTYGNESNDNQSSYQETVDTLSDYADYI